MKKYLFLLFITISSHSLFSQFLAGFSFEDNICVGSCINFTDTTSGDPVIWNWDFGTGASILTSTDQNPSNVCFNTAGVYSIQLTATNAAGVSTSTNNSITVHESPTVVAEHDTIIDLGGVVNLNAVSPDIGTVLWTPNTFYIDCDTCASTFAKPEVSTDYIVVFASPNGCTAEDTVSVVVNFIEGLGVPQAFSPNGDGQNDILLVKGFGFEEMLFRVYNRYGELVFESNNQADGWDGIYKNKIVNPGVFAWTIDYTLLNNEKGQLTGNVTLVR